MDMINFDGLLIGIATVSYTHLDVYKRQGVWRDEECRACVGEEYGEVPGSV